MSLSIHTNGCHLLYQVRVICFCIYGRNFSGVLWPFFFVITTVHFQIRLKINVVSVLEMIASNAWEKQIEKRDKTVKSLEKKYRRKCKALKVR